MGDRWRGDRGGSAVEAALLMVAVLVVLLPVAFAVGAVVRSSLADTCHAAGGCSSVGPGVSDALNGGAGGGGSSGDAGPGDAQVESAVRGHLAGGQQHGGAPVVTCPPLPRPPADTELACTATYPDGVVEHVTVRVDSDGHVEVVD